MDKSAGDAVVFYNRHTGDCAAGVGSALLTCFANIYTPLLPHDSSIQYRKNVFRQILSCPQPRFSSDVAVAVNCYRYDDYDYYDDDDNNNNIIIFNCKWAASRWQWL